MGSSEPDFETMSTSERILHVQTLWDKITEHPADVPLSDAQYAGLDRRLAAYDTDPSAAIPWEQARETVGLRK